MKRVFGFGDDDDTPPPAPKRPKLFDDDFGAKKEVSYLLLIWTSELVTDSSLQT